jgi:flagellar biosynthesis protein FlhB
MSKKSNTLGIISLILGIVSIVFFLNILVAVPAGIIGIVLAKMQNKRYPNKIAKAGFITSIIGIVLSILTIILLLTIFTGSFGSF